MSGLPIGLSLSVSLTVKGSATVVLLVAMHCGAMLTTMAGGSLSMFNVTTLEISLSRELRPAAVATS